MTSAERVLGAERESLLPVLRDLSEADFGKPTVCTEWTVLDVVAHVGSALSYVVRGETYDNSPEGNQAEVDQRRGWSVDKVLDEYEHGLRHAGPVIAASDGRLAGAALGTWIHGGDIREALGHADAYASTGVREALALLAASDRVRFGPAVDVVLPTGGLTLGRAAGGRPHARLECTAATLFRLYSGRPVAPDAYRLGGARLDELVSDSW
jgi:uncharacterized protein (TIGR03083 family)